MSSTNLKQGQLAEESACNFLQSKGLELYTTNYRCRCGEIDLIMGDSATLVFIEVRYRSHNRFGSGAESVDARKRARIIAAASHYLQTNPHQAHRPARFDVIAMRSTSNIQWIKDAFRT